MRYFANYKVKFRKASIFIVLRIMNFSDSIPNKKQTTPHIM